MGGGTITAQQFLQRLLPWSGEGIMILWGIMLWGIFIFALICMFRQAIPNTNVLLFLTAVVFFAFIDRVGVGWKPPFGTWNMFSSNPCRGLPLFFMRIAMFVFPLLAIAISKSEKSRVWGLIGGGWGAIYFFVRGLAEMGFLSGAFQTCDF
ncbi:MAG TPA: hypothetical protein PLD47_07435 [Aggregatilineales bacterium]|nr:hypothetical protein [Anaerolineales bacterium]HRE47541.1 hypothetical protein [Aggregatilineales bacterium]